MTKVFLLSTIRLFSERRTHWHLQSMPRISMRAIKWKERSWSSPSTVRFTFLLHVLWTLSRATRHSVRFRTSSSLRTSHRRIGPKPRRCLSRTVLQMSFRAHPRKLSLRSARSGDVTTSRSQSRSSLSHSERSALWLSISTRAKWNSIRPKSVREAVQSHSQRTHGATSSSDARRRAIS